MDRRVFVSTGALTLLNHPLALLSQPPAAPDLTIEGFRLNYEGGVWKIGADALKVNNLSLPVASWGWVALNVAKGIGSLIGGQIFSAIATALFGSKQPDISELLRQQLIAFAQILKDAFDSHDLAEAETSLQADLDLMGEYVGNPHGAGGRIEHLVPDTAVLLRTLERLKYAGYRTFIQTAGLRLAILQDLAGREGAAAKSAFVKQQERIQTYHAQMVAYITQQTEPAAHFDVCEPSDLRCVVSPSVVTRSAVVLGKQVNGLVKFHPQDNRMVPDSAAALTDYLNRRSPGAFTTLTQPRAAFIDWQGLRRDAFAETTDLGAPIVAEYLKAKPILDRRAAAKLNARWGA